MQAIEINGKVNAKGELQLDQPLQVTNRRVKVILLFQDETATLDETTWLQSLAANPAFDFLHDTDEDIYDISDGKPISDEI